MGWDGSGRKGRGTHVLWSPITFLKYALVKGAIPHREPCLLSMIALFRLMITAWKPVLKSPDMLELLIIRHEAKLDQPMDIYELRSKRIKIRRREFWQLSGDCGKYKMLVIQQQIAVDLQPHKKCSIIADSTYDSHKREATVFVTGESHTFGDLTVEGSSLRRVFRYCRCGTWRCSKGECHVL